MVLQLQTSHIQILFSLSVGLFVHVVGEPSPQNFEEVVLFSKSFLVFFHWNISLGEQEKWCLLKVCSWEQYKIIILKDSQPCDTTWKRISVC